MSRLFPNGSANLSPRARLENRYINARFSLLLIVAFTVINLLMRVAQNTTYWLFSANLPYVLTDIGMYFGGIYQNPTDAMLDAGFGMLGQGFFFGMLAIAIVITCAYFVCWLLSDKKPAWMIAALVLFAVDAAFMLVAALVGMQDFTTDENVTAFIIDLALHAYALYSLSDGIAARVQLAKLPLDEPTCAEAQE